MAQCRVPIEESFSWQRPVLDKDLNTPPGTPAKWDRYIVGPSPTGAWAGNAAKIAWCSNATGPVWSFDTPLVGWQLSVTDENLNYRHSGSAWVSLPAGHTQGTDTTLGSMSADIAMNTHQLTGLAVPDAAGEAIRQTATITESALGTAVSNSHAAGADTTLGAMSADINMNSKKITTLAAPAATGDALRRTATTTEATLDATVLAKAVYDAPGGVLLFEVV